MYKRYERGEKRMPLRNWWDKKRIRTRKTQRRMANERYTVIDFIIDVLFWIPEIIIFPFRLLIFFLRTLGILIRNFFEFI